MSCKQSSRPWRVVILMAEPVEMDNREAIVTIKANFPSPCYSLLRRACELAMDALEKQDPKMFAEDEHGIYCPSCGLQLYGKTSSGCIADKFDIPDGMKLQYCLVCGQKIDLYDEKASYLWGDG